MSAPEPRTEYRVECLHDGGWFQWIGRTDDATSAAQQLSAARAEYPHKRFRAVKITTTEEALDV